MKRYTVIVITFIIIVLSIIQVVVSSSLSTTGIELAKLESQVNDYKKDNSLKREKLLVDSSLTQIASRAAETGFIEEKLQVYIKNQLPVAAKP